MERRREKFKFLAAGNVQSGDEEVPDRSRNTSLRGRQMLSALYIDPSLKIGSSFLRRKERSAKMRRSTPPFLAGSSCRRRIRGRENDDLFSSRAPEYPLRAGLLCENDKSTGKATRNLDKIPRLVRVPSLASPARVFLKLIRTPRSFELSTIIVHLPWIPPPTDTESAVILNALLLP